MKLKSLALLAVLSTIITESFAFNNEKNDSLIIADSIVFDEVVIVGQRMHALSSRSPEALSVTNELSLQQLSPMSTPDVLARMPGVWMQKTNHGGGSPFIRGLTGYQTVIMIDGVRFNNGIFRSGPNQYLNTIDALSLQRVEVLRGSGSVQYGSDAIGGTVYLQTKTPEFSNESVKTGGRLYGKYMSHDMEKTGRGELQLAGKNLALHAGLSYRDFGDIHAGGDLGRLNATSYTEYATDVKAKWRMRRNQVITMAYQHVKQNDVQLFHKINPGSYALYSFDPQQRDMGYIKYKKEGSNQLFSEFTATASVQHSLEVRKKQKTESAMQDKENDRVYTWGFLAENISVFSASWKATTGAEIYYDEIESSAQTLDTESGIVTYGRGLYPDGSSMLNASVFSLHQYTLNRLQFTGGLRYNYIALQVADEMFGQSTIEPGALVGTVKGTWEAFRHTYLSLQANAAYRAPNINDVSSFGVADFRYEIPNFNLDPERSLTFEAGIKHTNGPVYVAFHVFRNQLTNLITNVRATYNGQDSIDGIQVYQRENSNKALLQGLEGEFRYAMNSRLVFDSYLMYTHGQNISASEPMRRIPPLNGKAGLSWIPLNGLTLFAETFFAASQPRLSGGDIDDDRIADGGTPGWYSIDVRAAWQYHNLQVNGGVANITNQAYRLHGSGVDAPGLSAWLSVGISF